MSGDRSSIQQARTGQHEGGGKASEGQVLQFWLMSMQVGIKAALECIKAFSETDFREDLKRFDVPTLFIHGDADQIVPIGASAMNAHKLVEGSQLKIYEGGDHALAVTHRDRFQADLLEFVKGLK